MPVPRVPAAPVASCTCQPRRSKNRAETLSTSTNGAAGSPTSGFVSTYSSVMRTSPAPATAPSSSVAVSGGAATLPAQSATPVAVRV